VLELGFAHHTVRSIQLSAVPATIGVSFIAYGVLGGELERERESKREKERERAALSPLIV
jgi:uncharacterized protein (DUF2062 family)